MQAFWLPLCYIPFIFLNISARCELEIFSGKTSALLLQGLNVAGSEFMHRHAELASTFTVVDSTETTLSCKGCLCMCAKAVVWEESQTLKAAKAGCCCLERKQGKEQEGRGDFAQILKTFSSHQHFILLLLCNIQNIIYCRHYF